MMNRPSSIFNRLSSVFCSLSSVLGPLHLSRVLYKSPLFMQNKPNFRKDKMNLSYLYTKEYKNFIPLAGQKNKPNSNPIKPNFRKAKMDVNLTLTKDYTKKDDFAVRKNKANSNPISVKPKMSANLYVIEDYENETAFRPQKNKPNQTQSVFLPSINEYMFISKTVKKSCARLWALLQCLSENFDKPGELKTKGKFRSRLRIPHLLSIGSSLIGAGDPMNLLGTMPAKEGKIDLKHSFYGSAFYFEFYKTGPRP